MMLRLASKKKPSLISEFNSTKPLPIVLKLINSKYKRTAAARNAVLNTAELLEKILLQLPAVDIVTSQRVSKQWRNSIKGSILMRYHLHSIVRPDEGEVWRADGRETTLRLSSKTYNFDIVFGVKRGPNYRNSLPNDDTFLSNESIVPASLNPFFTSKPAVCSGLLSYHPNTTITPTAAMKGAMQRILNGSKIPFIENMHFTSGPAPKIWMEMSWKLGEKEGTHQVRTPFKETGYTIGDVIEVALNHKTIRVWDSIRGVSYKEHSSFAQKTMLQANGQRQSGALEIISIVFRLAKTLLPSEKEREAMEEREAVEEVEADK